MKKLLFVLLLLPAISWAAGDAGCGLGSVVMSKNSKLLQILAVTTNGTFLSQLFGITSGTSNCSASGLVQNDKEVQYFVEINQQDLSRQMAQGKGEKLEVLAQLNGCQSTASQNEFMKVMQKSFGNIFTSENEKSAAVVENLKKVISNNKDLSSACRVAAL